MSYNYLAWDPDVVITSVYMKKPASGTSPISGGALLRAGTPLNNSKAVANTENAKYIVAEDYIFYIDPVHNADPVKLIEAGYVDLAKAQAAWGKSYTEDAIAALAENGITLVDGATLPSGGGGGGLPEVTADDNGDVLTVVEGEWAKAAPSGGGGVLIVGVDMLTRTLDKTYAEITAGYSVLASQQDGIIFFAQMFGYEPSSFSVSFRVGNDDMTFVADSADGYPVLAVGGGDGGGGVGA